MWFNRVASGTMQSTLHIAADSVGERSRHSGSGPGRDAGQEASVFETGGMPKNDHAEPNQNLGLGHRGVKGSRTRNVSADDQTES